ncbi:MAG: hypothetical protein C6Y22_29420 [Hapalosiphonaceae cyanobacterium JJU2]|nr:MAG: hypothetical protein C6Y22_29420 [Hapalosiphonaceae cyanobacterium JJU2]
MAINSELMQKLLPLLRPLMENESQRRGYLIRALGTNNLVQHRLVFNTPTNDFIPSLVNELVAFGNISPGKPALCALLEMIREDVGEDVKLRIDELLQNIREELKETTNCTESPNPSIKNSLTRTFTTSTYLDDWNQLETELNNWLSQNSDSVIIKNIQTEYIYTKGAKVSVNFLVSQIIDNAKPSLKARIFHGLHDSIVYTNIYKHSETKVESWNSNVASLVLGFGAFAVIIFQPN